MGTTEAHTFFLYWLKEKAVSGMRGADSLTVDGVKCDEAMIKVANHFKKRQTEGPLGIRAAEGVWFSALDGKGVTNRENDTLDFIVNNYQFDDPARAFLESKLAWLGVAADALAADAALAPNAVILKFADACALALLPPPPIAAPIGRPTSGSAIVGNKTLTPGTHVRLHGLTVACLNDVPGTCQEFDEARQRWMVKLSSGEVKALKPQNLMVPGRQVRLHSLASAAFNDLQGTCEEFDDYKQRWMVRLQSGDLKAFKAENLAVQVTGEQCHGEQSAESEPPTKRARTGPIIKLEKLRDIFDRCDVNKDGLVNKRELIKTCRRDIEIAKFFDVPSDIRQEDGSRNKLEEVFQEIDRDADREIRWAELLAYYRHRVVDL